MHQRSTRRNFLKQLAVAGSAVVLVPSVSACKSGKETTPADTTPTETPETQATTPEVEEAMLEVPTTKPEGWDPIEFNKTRGNQGAIPDSYLGSINGPDGENKHLGKHLPYQPEIDASLIPAGFIALMWGDPDKGHARHPNAPKNESNNNEGHWYNWIKIRKATDGEVQELQSSYTDWPGTAGDDNKYAVFGGGEDITSDSGKNTIYLAALPEDVQPGDTVRIYAHCLTHGEYVDFMTIS